MARDVYSLRIFAQADLTLAAGTVGPVVPDNLVYVLRDVDAIEVSGHDAAVLQVFSPVEGILWRPFGPTPYEPINFAWRGRQVYGPGEQVGFNAPVGTWSVTASGYQLSLP